MRSHTEHRPGRRADDRPINKADVFLKGRSTDDDPNPGLQPTFYNIIITNNISTGADTMKVRGGLEVWLRKTRLAYVTVKRTNKGQVKGRKYK